MEPTEPLAVPEPTQPAPPPDTSPPEKPKPKLADRLELAGALVAGVVGLEFLSLIIGISGGGPYRNAGDRIEVLSLNLDAKLGVLLLIAAMLVTIPEMIQGEERPERTRLGRWTLIGITALGGLIAVLALIGVGLDLSHTDVLGFGANQGAAVVHRLAILLMAAVAAGWSLAALGVRIITTSK